MVENVEEQARRIRDAEICRLYAGGASLRECGDQFHISRERVRQIVRRAGIKTPIRPPRPVNDRDQFLDASVSPSMHKDVKREAERLGTTISALVSEALDAAVKKKEV